MKTSSDRARPQLDDNAIRHLCKSLEISVIFADDRHFETAERLHDGLAAINLSTVLGQDQAANAGLEGLPRKAGSQDLAFLFHTSGTSSGLPKSIPQTHHAAVGVLPAPGLGEAHATFSTTPLYHGGIADCLRAWAGGATIHLFPGTKAITASAIVHAIDDADRCNQGACPVRYFTSVPYILQMLAAEKSSREGLQMLQRMHLVGVGGAALPMSLGDELVSEGVKLVSRFGSAECGFLLSSHRDYEKDREWSWLRADPSLQPDFYDFEPQPCSDEDEGPALFEFVVKPRWPHRGKINRPDGSFATADLFEEHPTIANAWRHHSRADAQITLSNGKKFDPAPVEGELLASAAGQKFLQDAMVFGTGHEAAGLLLVPRTSLHGTDGEQDFIAEVWPAIAAMNEKAQSHARISRGSIVTSRRNDRSLPKSSKGTILRRQAEAQFAEEIARAYGYNEDSNGDTHAEVADDEVPKEIEHIFEYVLGRKVDPQADLFSQGVDSIACMQVRRRILQRLLPASSPDLPMNIIYDNGSITRLADDVIRRRNANEAETTVDEALVQQTLDQMQELVEKYRHTMTASKASIEQSNRTVVLTGATGLLGAHILSLLLTDDSSSKVYCLVRAADESDAEARVLRSLKTRGFSVQEELQARLTCLPCRLDEDKLGLEDTAWEHVAHETTMIIHAAWPVNFALQLSSFEAQFVGLRGLLQLRDATDNSAARFVFISSTAAVSAAHTNGKPIAETLSADPNDASPLGYSRSKWVAEQICASCLPSTTEHQGTPIVIIRVGQLCGNERGVWNRTEAYPLLLDSASVTRCIPALEEPLSWLPVDQAAKAVLELSIADHVGDGVPVYHVLNRHQTPTWTDMMQRIVSAASSKETIEIVPPKTWLNRLEAALETNHQPAVRALLLLWRAAYGVERKVQGPCFSTERAEAASATIRDVAPLSEEAVLRMWEWINGSEQG